MEKQIKQIINGYKGKPNTKIFVGNLNPETTDEEIKSNFMRFGKICSLERKQDKDYLILEFEFAESA